MKNLLKFPHEYIKTPISLEPKMVVQMPNTEATLASDENITQAVITENAVMTINVYTTAISITKQEASAPFICLWLTLDELEKIYTETKRLRIAQVLNSVQQYSKSTQNALNALEKLTPTTKKK